MRLGDLDDLKVHISELILVYSGTELENAILKAINNAPTVIWCSETPEGYPLMDLRPRVKGEWIRKVDEVGFVSHICSECGAEIEVEDCSDDKFCFNCGAKMKGGTE